MDAWITHKFYMFTDCQQGMNTQTETKSITMNSDKMPMTQILFLEYSVYKLYNMYSPAPERAHSDALHVN